MDTQSTISEQNRDPLTGQPPGSVIETKEFLRTSEFWTTVAVIFGICIAGLALDALDSPRVSMLVTILAASYVVSRGIAKAGSAHPFWGRTLNMPGRQDGEHRISGGQGNVSSTNDSNDLLRRIEARLDRLEQSRGQMGTTPGTANRVTL